MDELDSAEARCNPSGRPFNSRKQLFPCGQLVRPLLFHVDNEKQPRRLLLFLLGCPHVRLTPRSGQFPKESRGHGSGLLLRRVNSCHMTAGGPSVGVEFRC